MAAKTDVAQRTRKLDRKQKKKIVKTSSKLPNSFVVFGRAVNHLWKQKKLFLWILAIYLALYVFLVKGLAASFQLSETKDLLNEAFEGELSSLETATTLFGGLLGTLGTTAGEAASVYQSILFVIFSLVIIWSLRRTFEDKEQPTVSQAFYQSSYPLIPFLLVGLVIILQALPALIGLTLFGIVTSNGIAVAAWEQISWFCVMILGVGLSTYFTSSSVFASYIVTLPNMAPMSALKSAKRLVKYRRFNIIRKFLFLPLVLFIAAIVVFLPLVFFSAVIAEALFILFSVLVIFVLHAYFYTLYRELL